ncbi:MAG: penicillin-binding protein 2 [Alphaproteobacteria bacterium]|nr:penicillin-binding protein 2 [Alphaproteobacteria bacterium]
MNRDMERYKQFSRRALLIGAGQTALFTILGLRLGYLEVVEQEKFQTLSDKNRISFRLVPAGRGEIMDRFGVPLAINTPNFRAFLVPEQTNNIEDTLDRLSRIIPVTEDDKQAVLVEVDRHKPFTPLLVKENLSWDDMAAIELRLPSLPGVSVDEGEIRSYPLGDATAHTIGYVGRVSEAEMTDDPVMSIPGFRIGKTGVEKKFDAVLRGQAGRIQEEVNVVGRPVRELGRVDPKKGHRLTLTLDADLQMQVQEMLSHQRSAAAVAMDALTGEVYALCSYPSFDPNLFSRGIPADTWEELLADETAPLTDKAVTGQYPPGSTFKMVTAMAAMASGVSADTRVFCPGYYMLGKDKFHCWKHAGHGSMGFTEAIEQSCDVFFYEMGKRTGIDNIAAMARRFGLGHRLDFDVPGERGGLIPDKKWKMKHYRDIWHMGETLNCAIGQGYVLTTPLQLATMTARLVGGGKAVRPVLVRSIEDVGNQIPEWDDLKLDPAALRIVRKGMEMVVNGPHGTARGSRITHEGWEMGGKSGTAQVRRITAAQRAAGVKNKDLPWKFRHHALFVAYAPVHKPRYVTAVVVEHGVGGSETAAPIAHDILEALQKRDPRRIHTVDEAVDAAGNLVDIPPLPPKRPGSKTGAEKPPRRKKGSQG